MDKFVLITGAFGFLGYHNPYGCNGGFTGYGNPYGYGYGYGDSCCA